MPPKKNVASYPSNLKLPNFEILFLKLPNHFLHFNELLGKTVPKLLVTYGMYHMHTLGASKCMHVVHSVGLAMDVGDGWFYLRFI